MCAAIAIALVEKQTHNTHKHKYANTQTQRQKQKIANVSFYKSKSTAGKETNVWPVALHRRGQQGRENSAHCKISDKGEKTLRTAHCKSYTVVCKTSLPGCTQLSTPNIALHTVRYLSPYSMGSCQLVRFSNCHRVGWGTWMNQWPKIWRFLSTFCFLQQDITLVVLPFSSRWCECAVHPPFPSPHSPALYRSAIRGTQSQGLCSTPPKSI